LSLKVIITGASSGIGRALAIEYDKHGATLGLISRSKANLIKTQKQLKGVSEFFAINITDRQSCFAMAKQYLKKFGPPDIIIANAGISHGTLSEEVQDFEAFKSIIDTNLLGVLNTFQPFIASMKKNGAGCLVGISSVAGIRGLPGASAYSASKSALTNYLEGLRVELSSYNLDVITIAPGYIVTPMTDVNPYPMPFIIEAESAAKKIIAAIRQKKTYTIIPWQMAIIARIMHLLPNWIWDFLAKKSPRKSR